MPLDIVDYLQKELIKLYGFIDGEIKAEFEDYEIIVRPKPKKEKESKDKPKTTSKRGRPKKTKK